VAARAAGARRPGAAQAFDADGRLVDEKVRQLLSELMAGFATFVGGGASRE
jgi:hypothetical protein